MKVLAEWDAPLWRNRDRIPAVNALQRHSAARDDEDLLVALREAKGIVAQFHHAFDLQVLAKEVLSRQVEPT